MKRIAIFDDDPELVQVLNDIFTHEGFTVLSFSVAPTIEQLEALQADVCLFDVWFDDTVSGAQLVEKILQERQRDPNVLAGQKLLMMSSDNDFSLYAGAPCIEEFFPKPLDFKELVATVHALTASQPH